MATATHSKAAQDREQREAKSASGQTYLVIPADPADFKQFEVKAQNKRAAEKAAHEVVGPEAVFTVEPYTGKKVHKAPVDPLAGMELDLESIPEEKHGGGGTFGPRDPAKSVWVARLNAIAESHTGKGMLRRYPKPTTAHSIAAALRKNLKTGKYEAAGIVAADFRIEVRGSGIYATYVKAA